MYHLAVSAESRSRGIGASLMEELENRLKEKGCLKYYLLVARDNVDAIRFYEKRGWQNMDDLFIFGKDL
jgi:ribosomal protein S18 acetylase RimI-like enzyme